MMMAASQLTQQVLDFQRGAFSSWYGVMSILQEQSALTVDIMLNQAGWIPDEGRQAMVNWATACREERDRYRIYMEKNFSDLENYLVQELKAAPVKSQKTVAAVKKAASTKPKTPSAEEKKATSA